MKMNGGGDGDEEKAAPKIDTSVVKNKEKELIGKIK